MKANLSLQQKAKLGREMARRAEVERESVADGRPVSTKTFSTKLTTANLQDQLVALWPTWLQEATSQYGSSLVLSTKVWRITEDRAIGPRTVSFWAEQLTRLSKHTWHVGRIRKGRGYFFEKASEAERKKVLALLPERGT
jgi:hypothetical protein